MRDQALSFGVFNFPAAAASQTSNAVDLTVADAFSATPRLGYVDVIVPALKNHTDTTKSITFKLQMAAAVSTGIPGSPTTLGAFADTNPLSQASLAGVTTSGSAAAVLRLQVPPVPAGTKAGPFQVVCTVPSGDGDNTASTWEAVWSTGQLG